MLAASALGGRSVLGSSSFLPKGLGNRTHQRGPRIVRPSGGTSIVALSRDAGRSISTGRDLYENVSGADVKILQEALMSTGYLQPGQATGFFGPVTKEATKKWQRDNNLPTTGFWGPLSRQVLGLQIQGMDEATSQQASPSGIAPISPPVKTTTTTTTSVKPSGAPGMDTHPFGGIVIGLGAVALVSAVFQLLSGPKWNRQSRPIRNYDGGPRLPPGQHRDRRLHQMLNYERVGTASTSTVPQYIPAPRSRRPPPGARPRASSPTRSPTRATRSRSVMPPPTRGRGSSPVRSPVRGRGGAASPRRGRVGGGGGGGSGGGSSTAIGGRRIRPQRGRSPPPMPPPPPPPPAVSTAVLERVAPGAPGGGARAVVSLPFAEGGTGHQLLQRAEHLRQELREAKTVLARGGGANGVSTAGGRGQRSRGGVDVLRHRLHALQDGVGGALAGDWEAAEPHGPGGEEMMAGVRRLEALMDALPRQLEDLEAAESKLASIDALMREGPRAVIASKLEVLESKLGAVEDALGGASGVPPARGLRRLIDERVMRHIGRGSRQPHAAKGADDVTSELARKVAAMEASLVASNGKIAGLTGAAGADADVRAKLEELERAVLGAGAGEGSPGGPAAVHAMVERVAELERQVGGALPPIGHLPSEWWTALGDLLEAGGRDGVAAPVRRGGAPAEAVQKLGGRVIQMEGELREGLAAMEGKLQNLEQALDAIVRASPAPPAVDAAAANSDLAAKMAALEAALGPAGALPGAVSALEARLAAVEERGPPADVSGPRVVELEARVANLENSLAEATREAAVVDQLARKIEALEAALAAPPAPPSPLTTTPNAPPPPPPPPPPAPVPEAEVAEAEPAPAVVPEPAPAQPPLEPLWRIKHGREILLQGFNWESNKHDWYRIVQDRVARIAGWGFTGIWLPPPSDSLAPQGYLPRDLWKLDTKYGSEAQLRDVISMIREHGMHAMADIVINHRCATHKGAGGAWNRWEGVKMAWGESAVTPNNPEYCGQGNQATGDDFHAAPNIDHTQDFVQRDIIEWLNWLTEDVGYSTLRFDFTKGYGGEFVGKYVEGCGPEFSIGEFWDTCSYEGSGLAYNQDGHRQRCVDWIDRTGGKSTAFDFTTKGILQEALGRGEYWRLIDSQGRPPGLIGLWPSHAVTFIDNHDTGSTQAHWPFPGDKVVQGYAYLLTHPGTPMVFWDHVFDWGEGVGGKILELVDVRRRMDLHSRSAVRIAQATDQLYAAVTDDRVAVKIGHGDWSPPGDGWEAASYGDGFCVWTKGG